MHLRAAHEHGADEGDSEAAADVAGKRSESGDLVVFLLRDADIGHDADGHEEKGHAEHHDDAPTGGVPEADAEVEAGDTPDAETDPGESEADHGAGIELLPKETHDGQKNDQHQAAEREHHSGLGSGVAHDLLQELRDHYRCGVKRGPDDEHDELGHA